MSSLTSFLKKSNVSLVNIYDSRQTAHIEHQLFEDDRGFSDRNLIFSAYPVHNVQKTHLYTLSQDKVRKALSLKSLNGIVQLHAELRLSWPGCFIKVKHKEVSLATMAPPGYNEMLLGSMFPFLRSSW